MKIRETERKYNMSWRTVRKAVDSVWPEPRKQLQPRPTGGCTTWSGARIS